MVIKNMGKNSTTLGIDIGSVSVKLVLIEDGKITRHMYQRFCGGPFETLQDILNDQFSDLTGQSFYLGLTGIGGKTAKTILGGEFFGEIATLAAGNQNQLPHVKTVIEMGGEDSKLLILDNERGIIEDFAMNAQCAAGTGSFLDQQAGRLKISIEEEFGQMALKSKNPPRIAGRCSVFAKSDMIHLQQIATPDYDIVAGLCYAVARNFKSSIARGKQIIKPIAFEGGVAANPGMERAFTDILDLEKGELIIPNYYNVMSAIGAALLAQKSHCKVEKFNPKKIEEYIKYRQVVESGRESLTFDFPENKFYDITSTKRPSAETGTDVYLGIDIGSLSTNVVLIDKDHNVIARRYLMTEGRPIEAVRKGLKEIGDEVGDRVNVRSVGTTGSGRYLIADFVGGDIVRNEITAQATAAINIDPTVDTIFEIGGQDSKYISIENKAVIDFEMNKACAAGTGSFLQEQAEKLNINIEKEFGDKALCSKCPVGCGERCTVFMESDLVSHQRSGAGKDDLLAGLAYSIAANYLNKVVGDRKIGDNIFFQGGVAWNKAVVAAFEKLIRKKVTVPPHHDVTGAIGSAILAIEKLEDENFKTRFKGFDLYKRQYDVDSFTCGDCSNQCEIHKVEIEGEEPLYYGARCEKYDVKTQDDTKLPHDYVRDRQKMLYKTYIDFDKPKKSRGKIGFPIVLQFYEYYPFWKAFFESLNYKVVNSSKSSQKVAEEALEIFAAETCFPIKLVYGHIARLLRKNVDTIFLPSLIRVADESEEDHKGSFSCPYVQSIGSSIRAHFDFEKEGVKFVNSPVSISSDLKDMQQKFKQLASDFKISDRELKKSLIAGLTAYQKYKKNLYEKGQDLLKNIEPDEKVIVIVSRPYNGYDKRISLELPEKIRNLGYKAIPLDFLPLEKDENDFSFMYWRYGQRIMAAADFIRNHKNLYAVFITSFGCGPDSFINHFFRKQMSGKPYLQLELDEHSADAGMITRCEAFIDSLRFHKFTMPITKFSIRHDDFKPFEKTIFIPNMCDHAYVLAAGLKRYGLKAEVLDEPDELTLDYGKKYTSGKECFPCVITTGDMIKKIRSEGFKNDKSVFFMPGADGPCRFGLYRQFHRIILDDLGYNDIPIFSPNSNDGYTKFGLEGTEFRKIVWKGFVFLDCLVKLLHKTRPYEKKSGEAEKLYFHYINKLGYSIEHKESLSDLAGEAALAFNKLEIIKRDIPQVGVVGEIYLRNNRFSNNHLITKLERLGMEVRLATFSEWPVYTSYTFRRDSFLKKDLKGLVKSNLQIFTQEHMEHNIVKAFSENFPVEEDKTVYHVLGLASKYLPLDVKGEAILSIGKAIEMANSGASGIVNAMPFNCMPGTIVSSFSRKVSDDLGRIPWLNISYEGLRDSGEDTRLEAFAEQVQAFSGSLKSSYQNT